MNINKNVVFPALLGAALSWAGISAFDRPLEFGVLFVIAFLWATIE